MKERKTRNKTRVRTFRPDHHVDQVLRNAEKKGIKISWLINKALEIHLNSLV